MIRMLDQAKYLDATRNFERVLVAAQAQQRSSEAAKAKPRYPVLTRSRDLFFREA
jgi:hypothetical protein